MKTYNILSSISYGQNKDLLSLFLLGSVYDNDSDGYLDSSKIRPKASTSFSSLTNDTNLLVNLNEIDTLLTDNTIDIAELKDDYASLAGDNTFAGTNTFSESIIVPTPILDTNAATKKYVDDSIIGSGNFNPDLNLTFTGDNDFQGTTSVITPTTDYEASTKKYVDDSITANNYTTFNTENDWTEKQKFFEGVEFALSTTDSKKNIDGLFEEAPVFGTASAGTQIGNGSGIYDIAFKLGDAPPSLIYLKVYVDVFSGIVTSITEINNVGTVINYGGTDPSTSNEIHVYLNAGKLTLYMGDDVTAASNLNVLIQPVF